MLRECLDRAAWPPPTVADRSDMRCTCELFVGARSRKRIGSGHILVCFVLRDSHFYPCTHKIET